MQLTTAAMIALIGGGCARPSPGAEAATRRPAPTDLQSRSGTGRDTRDFASLGAEATRDTVAPGLVHWRLRFNEGPWVVNVLDVDLAACWSPVALKGNFAGVGRERTTALLEQLAEGRADQSFGTRLSVTAGVNADFFRFNPPGIPLAAHVRGGRVIAGPSDRPVLAIDIAGVPSIRSLGDTGYVVVAGDTIPLDGWNRMSPTGLAVFDESWGTIADSASGTIEVLVTTIPRSSRSANGAPPGGQRRGHIDGEVAEVDTQPAGVPPGNGRVILVAGARAPASIRARLLALRSGTDSITVRASLRPFAPREAVGGFPILIQRGQVASGLDSAGGRNFGPVRHPRTAVGILPGAKRLLLVTVDGRQPGYSAGMTLPELATLMQRLGATEALNLDGGGSTTMAVSEGIGRTRILNQPSDSTGERPVANALAVGATCDSTKTADDLRRSEP